MQIMLYHDFWLSGIRHFINHFGLKVFQQMHEMANGNLGRKPWLQRV